MGWEMTLFFTGRSSAENLHFLPAHFIARWKMKSHFSAIPPQESGAQKWICTTGGAFARGNQLLGFHSRVLSDLG